jgi:hypothetical protein
MSRFSSCAPDMFPDEFPQSGYHVPTFPRFSGHPLGTSLELPHLRSSTGLHLNSLPISRCMSGLVPTLRIWFRPRSRSPDIMSGLSHALPEVHWALYQSCLTFGVLLNFVGCPLDFHSEIWGMYSGKGHSARAEAKPFLPNETLMHGS